MSNHTVRKFLTGAVIASALIGAGVAAAGTTSAFPGYAYCPGGGGGYGSFGYCDGPTYPDGSYDHTVAAMGGWTASQVCPPDPANPAIPLPWVPGQQCAFSK